LGNTLTDERGRFVFTGVGPATYFINAVKAGYSEGHYGPGVNGALGGNIVLAAGEWFDAANIELLRLSAIGGHIVDERGEPVVGAYVRVLTQALLGGATHLVAGPAATTDDLGEYRISGLRPGRYIVTVPSVQQAVPVSASVADVEGVAASRLAALDAQAVRTGVQPARRAGGELVDGSVGLIIGNYITPPPRVDQHRQAYPAVFYPGTSSVLSAAWLEIGPGEEKAGIDVSLQPLPAVRVSGRLDSASTNVRGMVLRLVPTGLEDLGEGSEAATTAVLTDGAFTFLDVPAGAYTLTAPGSTFEFALRSASAGSREPNLPATPAFGGYGTRGGLISAAPGIAFNAHVSTSIADDHAGFVRMPLVVGAIDIDDLVVPTQRTASIHGQLLFEDLPGQPPAGAIELTPANAAPELGAHSANTLGTSRDSFEFPLVLPGDYALRVNMTGLTIKSIMVGGEDCSRRPISVSASQDVAVSVTLTGKVIRVSGVVRDAQGAAVPQASVIAFPIDRQLWTNYGFVPTWIRPSVGTSNGSYQIANIRAGYYYLVGVDPSHLSAWADPAFLESVVPFAVKTTVNWGDGKTLDVPLMVKK
jgi:hypothetical protein